MKRPFWMVLPLSFILGSINGCATSPDDIPAASVSEMQYINHDCDAIALEFDRVSRKLNTLYASLDKKAGRDTAQMTAGILLLWPTLFFLEGGDGAQAQEYAMLKGEFDALEKVAIRKKCAIPITERPKKKEQSTQQSPKDEHSL